MNLTITHLPMKTLLLVAGFYTAILDLLYFSLKGWGYAVLVLLILFFKEYNAWKCMPVP